MTRTRLVIFAGLLLSFVHATPTDAQIETLSRTAITTSDSTIDRLTKRLAALENTVAQLQQKIAFIKSVSPLMLDAGTDGISIRGGQISIDAHGAFNLRAGSGAQIESGSDLTLKGGANTFVRSSGQLLVQAGAILDLKGSSVRLNGGTFPVACAGSAANGQTASGGGLRTGEHTHTVALPLAPCSSTVLVPGPGQ